MKKFKIWLIIAISCIASPYLAHKIHATCAAHHNKISRKHVMNCTYSQKDLSRILAANNDRYRAHSKNKTCFYCGCPVNDHSGE